MTESNERRFISPEDMGRARGYPLPQFSEWLLVTVSCQQSFVATHPKISILDWPEMPTIANVGEDQTIDALGADQAAFHRPTK